MPQPGHFRPIVGTNAAAERPGFWRRSKSGPPGKVFGAAGERPKAHRANIVGSGLAHLAMCCKQSVMAALADLGTRWFRHTHPAHPAGQDAFSVALSPFERLPADRRPLRACISLPCVMIERAASRPRVFGALDCRALSKRSCLWPKISNKSPRRRTRQEAKARAPQDEMETRN